MADDLNPKAEATGGNPLKGAVRKAAPAPVAAPPQAAPSEPQFQELPAGDEGAQQFHAAIGATKAANPNGASVTQYDPSAYASKRLFLTPDRSAGYALDNGDIQSVFKHPQSPHKGVAQAALAHAVQNGGNRLDAFDTALPHLYGKSGFRTVARIPWNEDYKPEGWDKSQYAQYNGGEPDVVFMVHDPKHAKPYVPGEGPTVNDYEHGVDMQKDALAAKHNAKFGDFGQAEDSTVSTRIPGGKNFKGNQSPHETDRYRVGIESATADPKHSAKNVSYYRKYPGVAIPKDATADEANAILLKHMHDNLVGTYDAIGAQDQGPEIQKQSAEWYDGAHRLTKALAEEHGYSHQQVAGAMAALSPQKDWYQNVELGKRLIDIDKNHQNTMWSPEMSKYAEGYATELGKKYNKAMAKRAALEAAGKPVPKKPPENMEPAMRETIARLQDKTFGQLKDPYEQAVWARFRDQAHNLDRSHPSITPRGDYGPTVMQQGDPTKTQPVAWGSFDQIGNAITALKAKDMPTISKSLGDMHKIRSFYNNIIHPNEPNGAVTNDTHAISTALFRPVGSADKEVNEGLGGGASKNAEWGNKGLYGLYDEANRMAARTIAERAHKDPTRPEWERNILPRQVQSVTWDGIRTLFNNKSAANKKFAADQWNKVSKGEQSADDARREIIARHGGFSKPSWWNK